MIKLTFCLRWLSHLTCEEFQAHWIGQHRDIMLRNKQALGYRRYLQAYTIGGETAARIEGSRGGLEPYDGTAEAWYDSMEAFESALASEAGRRTGRELIEDEKRSTDMKNSPVWLSEERVIEAA